MLIKDYILKERLGVGSYGTVFKAEKKNNNNEIFVIKQISLFSLTEQQINEVKLEAKILSSIKSNYVVKYYDSFEENNNLNIVMEYCDGGDLSNFIEKNKQTKHLLKEDLIWELFIKMTLGLASIHKLKILHRDLKTANIFLTKNLDIKIGDLGVAKILTQTNFAKTFIGTPYYLSPEICEEKPYNEKSDIWALGCILYELCTYNHPFNARSQGALILKILNDTPNKLHSYYSNDLQNMINLLLEKNEKNRPSCGDILRMTVFLNKGKKFQLYNCILKEIYISDIVFKLPEMKKKETKIIKKVNITNNKSSSNMKQINKNNINNRKINAKYNVISKKSNNDLNNVNRSDNNFTSESFTNYHCNSNNHYFYNINVSNISKKRNIVCNKSNDILKFAKQNSNKSNFNQRNTFDAPQNQNNSKKTSINNSSKKFHFEKHSNKKQKDVFNINLNFNKEKLGINKKKQKNENTEISNVEKIGIIFPSTKYKNSLYPSPSDKNINANKVASERNKSKEKIFYDKLSQERKLNKEQQQTEYIIFKKKESKGNIENQEKKEISENKINKNIEIKQPTPKNKKYDDLGIDKNMRDVKQFANFLNGYVDKYKKVENSNNINNNNLNKNNNSNSNIYTDIKKEKQMPQNINTKKTDYSSFIASKIEKQDKQEKESNNKSTNFNEISPGTITTNYTDLTKQLIHPQNNQKNTSIDINASTKKSIYNFQIINNNGNDSVNIFNNNDSVLVEDEGGVLYSEEENSEEKSENVQEIIIENDTKEIKLINSGILNEKKNIENKICHIKEDMLKLIGENDYDFVMGLYGNVQNKNIDEIYEKIETFVNSYYDEEKKENFNNLYYLLISLDCQLAKKKEELKNYL